MKKLYFLIVLFSMLASSAMAQVAVNTDGSLPDNSAMLDVKSTSKGFLPPRMTTVQRNAIVSPAKGLLVFDITLNSLFWFNGLIWKQFNEPYMETDPVFTAHPASGITAGNIGNWNTAYGWGNHAAAGYLTSFTEADPIFGASAAAGITGSSLTNWNLAYTRRINTATGTWPLTLLIANNDLTGSIAMANSVTSGYLNVSDWNTFNNKISSQWISNGSDIHYNTGKVGIGTSNPDASSVLDVSSATKGFLPPRVALTATNAANPVISPASGLLVYNTATAGYYPNNVVPSYYYWDGAAWTSLGLPPGTIGQTLRFDGSNWIASSVLKNDGTNIGIGTPDPTHKLTITGTTQTLRLIGPGSYGSTAQLNFGDGNYVYISEDIDDKLLIYSSTRTAITGGNVGIGTTTPDYKLSVAGIIQTTSGGIRFPDGTTQSTAAGNIHSIGESYGGGIVFYVYDGGQHGLIAATTDQGTNIHWDNGTFRLTGSDGYGVNAGSMNTAMIVATQIADNQLGDFAARVCASYSVVVAGVTYGDWYLPSKFELNLLYLQRSVVGSFASAYYWSSSEVTSVRAWEQTFNDGNQYDGNKNNLDNIRAIRSF